MVQNEETRYIARILDGETEYFSVLLDRYSRPLYSLIVQIVGCSEDAEELVQDVFLKAFRNLSNYKGEFLAPHSRHTEVSAEDIHNCKALTVLAESREAGVFLCG